MKKTTTDLDFEDFESGFEAARWRKREVDVHQQVVYAQSNAGRVKKVPAASIIRNAPNGFSESRVTAMLFVELFGDLALTHDDAYVIAFSYGMRAEIAPVFAEHADYFFDVLWRMLELGAAGLRWGTLDPVIREWAAAGRLDRARLLRTLRETLTQGHGNAVAKWASELYVSLDPTLDEHARGQASIRAMLRAPERSTVRLAVELATALHAAGRLEVQAFLESVPDLAGTTAVNARDVLRIATGSVAADEAGTDAARAVVATALGHPGRDIQKLAVSWLNANGAADLVAQSSDLMSPAIATSAAAAQAEQSEIAEPVIRRRLERWSIDDAVTRMAVLLEDGSDPLEIEAALQALAALEDLTLMASLQKRAQLRAEGGDDVPNLLGRLVLAALGIDTPPAADHSWLRGQEIPVLVTTRVDEVRVRLLRRESRRELLATPYDSAGWVSAEALVERMRSNDAAGLPVWQSDLTAALLRLDEHDPHRSDALRIAEAFAGSSEAWAAIAYALGGSAARVVTASWWVAAARSRSDAHDDALAAAGLTLPGQALPLEARMRVQAIVEPAPWKDENATHTAVRFDTLGAASEVTRERPRWNEVDALQFETDQPTVIPFRSQVPDSFIDRPAVARWVGLTWPRSTEFAASVGVMQLAASSLDGSEHPTLTATLDALAESPAPFGELGRSCVAFGLSAKHATHRAQTAEILAADLGTRLDISELARTMVHVLDACKTTRWASSLADAAVISARARRMVIALLTALLPQLETTRSGMAALLEVLDDALRRAGAAPSDPELLAWLATFSGSSKAAKAAKSILGLTS